MPQILSIGVSLVATGYIASYLRKQMDPNMASKKEVRFKKSE